MPLIIPHWGNLHYYRNDIEQEDSWKRGISVTLSKTGLSAPNWMVGVFFCNWSFTTLHWFTTSCSKNRKYPVSVSYVVDHLWMQNNLHKLYCNKLFYTLELDSTKTKTCRKIWKTFWGNIPLVFELNVYYRSVVAGERSFWLLQKQSKANCLRNPTPFPDKLKTLWCRQDGRTGVQIDSAVIQDSLTECLFLSLSHMTIFNSPKKMIIEVVKKWG